ncbi:MAG: hypothetical protein U0W24_02690 [Bacteroidales bacterium]
MKIYTITKIISLISVCLSCNLKNSKQSVKIQSDTIFINDTIYRNISYDKEWQKSFGLTHDPNIDSIWFKPVSFYLDDINCSGLAEDFYYGYLRPSDNGTTTELLKLATTGNTKLRPFYRWCLDKTIEISDGALGELIGVPARQYAEKFPEEFFEYMDSDTTGQKYKRWTNAISYSGFYDTDKIANDIDDRNIRIVSKMMKNLKIKDANLILRIKKFSVDCLTYKE